MAASSRSVRFGHSAHAAGVVLSRSGAPRTRRPAYVHAVGSTSRPIRSGSPTSSDDNNHVNEGLISLVMCRVPSYDRALEYGGGR
jgi:hypothetical protein